MRRCDFYRLFTVLEYTRHVLKKNIWRHKNTSNIVFKVFSIIKIVWFFDIYLASDSLNIAPLSFCFVYFLRIPKQYIYYIHSLFTKEMDLFYKLIQEERKTFFSCYSSKSLVNILISNRTVAKYHKSISNIKESFF